MAEEIHKSGKGAVEGVKTVPIAENNEKYYSDKVHRKPNSPHIPLVKLITVLSRALPEKHASMVKKLYAAFQGRKLSRVQLIDHLRKLVGDDLLIRVTKAYDDKHMMVKVTSAIDNMKSC